MNQKIIFFDIDGTLHDSELGVTELTKQAIKELLKNGHIPVICTGRARIMVPDYLMEMGFSGIVAGAGTFVEYQGNVIHNKVMGPKEGDEIIATLKECGIRYILEGPENIYIEAEDTSEEYQHIIEFSKRYTKGGLKAISNGNYIINKLTCFPNADSRLDLVAGRLGDKFHMIHHIDGNFEMTPKGYDKSTGIQILLENLKLKKEDTYAFGDSTNDMEMLSYVQYGIAMGNSYPQVLEAAKYKTLSIREDGIYHGLKSFGLI
ncbi:Cof-type HAD-IIB family hydrolase [Anaerocolumna chitinilytica]|uniref:Hydrolase n=1 Tax=Anaerocolumna chitinilytica TaxID=1727145 RepID=A0A7M3S9C0_9FIRM|nr:Cof-type HAD-IIB family hydrolase [Anaerocolumna chitinilytica]BCK01188.1 hydrolase [Anaerocolumna chitinilytica]